MNPRFRVARNPDPEWWQTQKTVHGGNPGARVPRGRLSQSLTVAIDTRERYGWKFSGRDVATERRALSSGDYGLILDSAVIAVVERKTMDNLATALSDGTLAFQLQRLAETERSAVVGKATIQSCSERSRVAARGSLTCWHA